MRLLGPETDLPDVAIQAAAQTGFKDHAVLVERAAAQPGHLKVCGSRLGRPNHWRVVAEGYPCRVQPRPPASLSTLHGLLCLDVV
jgi:hypothetical protein